VTDSVSCERRLDVLTVYVIGAVILIGAGAVLRLRHNRRPLPPTRHVRRMRIMQPGPRI
jgi:hypothetical protein